jgi:hypothetical protein
MNKPQFRNDYCHIGLQKQVTTDVYTILINRGLFPQTPVCISITTKDGRHTIPRYYYDNKDNHWGSFEHYISVEIDVDYEYEDLEKLIKSMVVKKQRILDETWKPYIDSINERFSK